MENAIAILYLMMARREQEEVDLVQNVEPQPGTFERCRDVLLSASSAQKWPAGTSSTMVSPQEGPSSWEFPEKGWSLGHKYSPFN